MAENRIFELTTAEIVQAIRSGELTAKEVCESFVERAQLIDSKVHAWVTLSPEFINRQAESFDKGNSRGLLSGVPIGVKDIFNTEFYPTQKGSEAWSGYQAGNDARCVSYLKNHGAIIFGKTDTAELAVHALGKAKNPYDSTRVTGSSSGGSAAAVATAMVPAALGSQTGGSTIRPASWCGVFAMKPSFGLIPRTGVLKTTDTLDTIGFFARSPGDLKLLLEAMRIRGENFPIQTRELASYEVMPSSKWRVAFVQSHLSAQTKPYVQEALDRFKRELSQLENIEVVTLPLPESVREFQSLHRRIYHPCLAYYLKSEYGSTAEKISDSLKSIFEDASQIPPEDYCVALREQSQMAKEMSNFFSSQKVDFIFSNSSNGSAPEVEPERHVDLNQLWTMAWLPVANVPKFYDERGLPFGLSVVGPRYSDYRLLHFLKELSEVGVIPKSSKIVTPSMI